MIRPGGGMGVTVAVTRERSHLTPGSVIWLWDVCFVSKLIQLNTMRDRDVKMTPPGTLPSNNCKIFP